jgi:type I restriction enzyme M protein
MALKKSALYSSLWASCDELRGGMDASQYKDYVLFMLFIKYISDKYANSDDFAPPVVIPAGASFADMVALKGKSDIGDKINTQIIQPLIDANARLARSDFPDFNDPNKLGQGKDMVDRLTNLVAIFQKPELDFSDNRAEHDDILGDAYEYLMRHFATESGKSKGQFYTPSEVSRVIAKVIGIGPHNTKASTTAYDPTCGSGSLLLKVAAQAAKPITLEGQEMDVTTAGLARMNMILHDFPTANIQLKHNRPPLLGIFAVELYGLNGQPLPGVASLGVRPTVKGADAAPVLEVHLFDFNADIYNRRVRVDFLHKLRDEEKYPDLPSLVAQIGRDVDNAKRFLAQRRVA